MTDDLVDREVTVEEREILSAIANNPGSRQRTQKRAKAVLGYLEEGTLDAASDRSGYTRTTARKWIKRFSEQGWQELLYIPTPRGGDFLARYDQGYWAESLTRQCLDNSSRYRPVPYGTSRSEPFTDQDTFREYAIEETLQRAWSHGRRWKRPDLLTISRSRLIEERGNDEWIPDLQKQNDEECKTWIQSAAAGFEVETSRWHVGNARAAEVDLSFTIKDEDLELLRNWISETGLPLYVVQVFFDMAFVLPFDRLEGLLEDDAIQDEVDRTTDKATYNVPLREGTRLGRIPDPDIEGRKYIAPNGRVTLYGHLSGSRIEPNDQDLLDAIADGSYGH